MGFWDRLDAYDFGTPLVNRLMLPGRIILWINYMFPKGYGSVASSYRQSKSPVMIVLYSLGFYGFVLIATLGLMAPK